jgi:hypothetical protein
MTMRVAVFLASLMATTPAGIVNAKEHPSAAPISVSALAVADKDTVYAATLDGVFKSANGGRRWTPINSGLPTSFIGNTIAVDPKDNSTLYIAGESLFKSIDAGGHWESIGSSSLSLVLTIVSTVLGMFKSVNAGDTWNLASTGLPTGSFAPFVVTVDPTSASIAYAGTGISPAGIWKTTDGGGLWTPINDGLPVTEFPGGAVITGVGSITIDPDTPTTLYAGMGHSNDPLPPAPVGGFSRALTEVSIGYRQAKACRLTQKCPRSSSIRSSHQPCMHGRATRAYSRARMVARRGGRSIVSPVWTSRLSFLGPLHTMARNRADTSTSGRRTASRHCADDVPIATLANDEDVVLSVPPSMRIVGIRYGMNRPHGVRCVTSSSRRRSTPSLRRPTTFGSTRS